VLISVFDLKFFTHLTLLLALAGSYKLFAFCSVSSLMTTTESIIVEIPKEEKEAPAMGGMGGMDY
jgi:hypothetical protein